MSEQDIPMDGGLDPSGLTINEAVELQAEVKYLRVKAHALDKALAELSRKSVSDETLSTKHTSSDREKSLLMQLDAKDVEIARLKNGISNSQALNREHMEAYRRTIAHALYLAIRRNPKKTEADKKRMDELESAWKSGLPEARRR